MRKEPAYLELMFRPNVDLVSIVRRFVLEFYEYVFVDPETSSRLALASHELLENAVKYSSTGETRLRLHVSRDASPSLVSICTWNEAGPADIDTLARTFETLRAAPNAFDHYQEQMRQTVQRDEGSGLGLVRILAEAEMNLKCVVNNSTVCVTAETLAELRREDDIDRGA